MNPSLRTLSVAIVLGLGALCLAAARGGDGEATTRVGVVNMKRLFRKYDKAIDFDQRIESQKKLLEGEKERRESELALIEDEAEELEAGTPAHLQKVIELRRRRVKLEYWWRTQGEELTNKLVAFTEEIQEDIRQAAEEVAEVRGLDLVLNYEPPDDLVDPRLRGRTIPIVLFAAPQADITERILARLHRSEEEAKEGSPPEKQEGPPGKSGE